MAEQKADFEQKKQDDLLAQYQREQEVLENRALLGDQKAKLGLTFLYDAPPGADRAQEVWTVNIAAFEEAKANMLCHTKVMHVHECFVTSFSLFHRFSQLSSDAVHLHIVPL